MTGRTLTDRKEAKERRARASLEISKLVIPGTGRRLDVRHHVRMDDCTLANSAVERTTAESRAQTVEVRRRVLGPLAAPSRRNYKAVEAASTAKSKCVERHYRRQIKARTKKSKKVERHYRRQSLTRRRRISVCHCSSVHRRHFRLSSISVRRLTSQSLNQVRVQIFARSWMGLHLDHRVQVWVLQG